MSCYKRGLRVCGVPGHLFEEELLRDKLLIHFLRPKNQGGEIQNLHYPTKDEGVAILTFEEEEVAERILKTQHLLDVNGQLFPLEVMRLQFSMPVITSLDLSRLKNKKLLVDLFEKHKVMILNKRDEMFIISAEFEDLRQLRSEIMATVLTCDTSPLGQRSQKQISESGPESPVKDNLGVKPSSQQPSGNDNNVEKPQSRRTSSRSNSQEKHPSRARRREANMAPTFSNAHILGHRPTTDSVAQGSNPTSEGGMSFKTTRDPIVRMNNDSASQMLSDLNLGSSTNRGQPSIEATRTTRNPSAITKDFPSQASLVKSFSVDNDVLYYIRIFETERVDEVLKRCAVNIQVAEGEDISNVTLKSQSPSLKLLFSDCCDEILQIFSEWQSNLRTEDLDLTQFPTLERRKMTEKIQHLGRAHGVAIIASEDGLHLIGGPSQIHWLIDWWKTISQPRPPDVGREAVNTREIHLPHPPNMGRSYTGANEKKTNHGDQDMTQVVRRKGSVTGSHQSGDSMRRETSTESSSVSSRTNSYAHGITHPKP
ncbi:uncharacterized protein XB22065629.L [Xenopus laevis]|uniref:Uncharacterized protein XB22065629.L n=2 Tax=Xenopus laevis TaxID=8355 RepID=A0A1L8FUT5_XENLA|nr:uncharacterized protein XB22065629.L [Xenopus laevis]XP_018122494.1 uncharacterized protein XB22065629.L [Xenopus laevis]XP_018122495.1 uncharacterized protein XB22065629.L [Xenopus laevis]XP_018122496.1 uncharacterized protein XB22065629.L [Xenopus laevis]OCT75335.1 hypothetical protein XELAEV_18030514mg [Xenopus laevis]